ncbi:unnamed protein product [Penicillium olsonii]|uniref:Uncharacterized protein n=1 Tax=Penicillium olsonii TaxID=99116 RepID=A0A9W4HW66_PENOL|nr:unnamed protein product [Penicillium olsonii]CAG8144264.1 unnamed protein product [Penicillium olsonii]
MVSLTDVQASNANIATALPAGLVAVFVGATNGIGEATVKEFARSTHSPHAYLVGRSQEAAARIIAECRQLNPVGEFIFIQADVSLMRNVDEVCHEIKSKERAIDLLFLSYTSEGLHIMTATAYYARIRFILNFLPLLRQSRLRRVVTVLAGGHEGPIDASDFQGRNMSMLKLRGHIVSMTELALEKIAEQAPEVSFVHDYPGTVKTGIGRDPNTLLVWLLNVVLLIVGPWIYIPNRESGERHLFFATSAKYPPKVGDAGVSLIGDRKVAAGTDGKVGSGVYSVHWDGEHAAGVELLAGFRAHMAPRVWEHTIAEFKRITGELDSNPPI